MDDANYETTPFRAIPALFAGAVVGTAIIVIAIEFLYVTKAGGSAAHLTQIFQDSSVLTFLTPFVFAIFCVGAVFIAAPCWWLLHRMGRRTRIDAMLLGAILCAAAGFVPTLSSNQVFPYGDLVASAVMALAGGVAGLAAWRLAYRVVPDEP